MRGFEAWADDLRLELRPDSGHFIAEELPGVVADRPRAVRRRYVTNCTPGVSCT